MGLLEICGWLGSLCLALCAVPFAWQSYKEKKSDITSWGVALWLVGEVLISIYVIPKRDYPLIFNYALNIACLAVVVRYKFNK